MEKRKKHHSRRRAKMRRLYFQNKMKQVWQGILFYIPAAGTWAFRLGAVSLFAFGIVFFLGQRVSTVGDSMEPVLQNGDVVLVNRVVYNAKRPNRGDIIVFKPKGDKNSHYYIKRVIGLPEETVEIIENGIYIDGERLEEEYVTTPIDDAGIAEDKVELGSDEYFVLGDDRENSKDSRDEDVGKVKRSYIYGKAWFVISFGDNFGFVKG